MRIPFAAFVVVPLLILISGCEPPPVDGEPSPSEMYRVEGTFEENGDEVRVRDEGSWLAVVRRDADDRWRFYRWAHNTNLPQAPVPVEEE